MDGADLIAALRRERGMHLPVILMSGASKSRMLGVGADAILPKPFPVTDLLALLDRFLSVRSTHHPAV